MIALLALFVGLLTACGTTAPEQPAPLPQPEPPPAPAPWPSPEPPADLPADPDMAKAAAYSWDQFLALAWPVDPQQRGRAWEEGGFGAQGLPVWASWKADHEVFLEDGSKPPPWNDYGPIPPECLGMGATADAHVMTRVSKSPRGSSSEVFRRVQQAVGGTLTDQNGLLVRYELRMDRTQFEDVVAKELYNLDGQDRLTGPVDLEDGSMEIKAAWRELTEQDGPAARERMYVLTAWVYTPPQGREPAKCELKDMGLVGLHVTAKTPTRPQWTWATFEHVDNVPRYGEPGVGTFAFHDPSCPPERCVPNRSTEVNGEPTGVPTQVTRTIAIDDDVVAANAAYQTRLEKEWPKTPWRYYELVGLQFPRNPAMPTGDPTPANASNVTMETFLGTDSSCMDCHFMAKTGSVKNPQPSDFSYFLAEAHPRKAR